MRTSQEQKKSQTHKNNLHVTGTLIAIIRNIAGIFLCLLVYPPVSIGIMNVFVILPGIFGGLILCWPLFRFLIAKTGPKHGPRIFRFLLATGILAITCLLIGLFMMLSAAQKEKSPEDAVVIVLGSQVINSEPSWILSARIRVAAEFLKENPAAICIASGGQGPDEDISEAQCIRDTLIEDYGIDAARIIMEDRSTSTRENLFYSSQIIEQMSLSTDVVIATDGFHQFRAKKIASNNNLTPFALPARTDSRLVFYMSLRELFAIAGECISPTNS